MHEARAAKSLLAALGALVLLGKRMCNRNHGPLQSPLRVTTMYTVHGSGGGVREFQAGAMPGCYGQCRCYLNVSNSFFQELYSQS